MGSKNARDWHETQRNSSHKRQVKNHLADLTEKLSALPVKQDDKTTFIIQLWAVTDRNLEQDWRIPSYFYAKILLSIGTIRLLRPFSPKSS